MKPMIVKYLLPSIIGRGRGVGLLLLLASLMLGACSTSDDDGNNAVIIDDEITEAPEWQIDWNNNQERPNWTKPDGTYENWTTMVVKIEDVLEPFASKDDLLALFINDEVRGLASPAVVVGSAQSNGIKFVMKVWGNETGTEIVDMSLKYYSHKLKHIFTLSDRISLSSDESTGVDEDYIPEFTLGSAKYPVVKTVSVETYLTKGGIKPISGNMVAAFVGEECRGTVSLSASGNTQLLIYGRNAGESLTLKYYDATAGKLYTLPDAVKMK